VTSSTLPSAASFAPDLSTDPWHPDLAALLPGVLLLVLLVLVLVLAPVLALALVLVLALLLVLLVLLLLVVVVLVLLLLLLLLLKQLHPSRPAAPTTSRKSWCCRYSPRSAAASPSSTRTRRRGRTEI
jgi:hypothetical protein